MFSKRKNFSQSYKYDKEFLCKLISEFKEAGLDDIIVKLPHNLINDQNDEISIDNFLERDRNYPSIILIAKNKSKEETIKILFINISKKAFFKDDTFPSGHSEPPEFYVSTNDPVRTIGLFEYFFDRIKQKGIIKNLFISFISLFSFFFLFAEGISVFGNGMGIIAYKNKISNMYDFIIVLLAMFFIYKYYEDKRGLYIKTHDKKVFLLLKKAIRGDFRDNPVVTFAITIFTSLFVLAIWELIKKYFEVK